MRSIVECTRQLLLGIYLKLNDANKRANLSNFKKQGRLQVGEWTYGLPIIIDYSGNCASKVIIGKFCSIAENVQIILGGDHCTKWVSTYPFRIKFSLEGAYQDGHPFSRGDVIIQNDVWIGRNVLIRDGVTIGNGAVIGCGSVVTKDVAPYEIAAGNPCKKIGMRFSDEDISALLRISWWDWPLPKILNNVQMLSCSDIGKFIQKFYNEAV